ncbi:MAG: class I poly(R)-hydroxyalkanoic acid synthase, partial [Alphaproteobacteria bacterium]
LRLVEMPAYIQAGREDHIAPAERVWRITRLFRGPLRFVLAGSGHIAGVVNPPSSGKYQYWTNDQPAGSLGEFVAGATETKGSWWPDWLAWLRGHSAETVPATGARVPGQGDLVAICDAPGDYVRAR